MEEVLVQIQHQRVCTLVIVRWSPVSFRNLPVRAKILCRVWLVITEVRAKWGSASTDDTWQWTKVRTGSECFFWGEEDEQDESWRETCGVVVLLYEPQVLGCHHYYYVQIHTRSGTCVPVHPQVFRFIVFITSTCTYISINSQDRDSTQAFFTWGQFDGLSVPLT